MQRLASAARAHVGVEVECVGSVPSDPSVPASVRARVPLLVHAGSSPAARAIRGIEARLAGCDGDLVPVSGGLLPALAARLGVRWAQSAAAAVASVAALGGVVAR